MMIEHQRELIEAQLKSFRRSLQNVRYDIQILNKAKYVKKDERAALRLIESMYLSEIQTAENILAGK